MTATPDHDDTAYNAASDELSRAMVPMPDDFVEDLSPPAALLFLRQATMAVAKVVLGATIALGEDEDESDGPLGEIMRGVMAAVAGTTHACVAIGMLPQAAETELELAARLP